MTVENYINRHVNLLNQISLIKLIEKITEINEIKTTQNNCFYQIMDFNDPIIEKKRELAYLINFKRICFDILNHDMIFV